MKRLAIVLAALPLLAVPAMAQDFDPIEGLYASEDGNLTADVTGLDSGRYSVSLSTVVPISDEFTGCAGGVDGEFDVVENAGVLKVANETDAAAPACEVSLTFSEDGTLITEELGGCIGFHGASCEFTGTLFHDAAGI